MTQPDQSDLDRQLRRTYEGGQVYQTNTICSFPPESSPSYNDELLADKIHTVRRHLQSGLVVDLCCATGEHLVAFSSEIERGVGIDFSVPFVVRAACNASEKKLENLYFAVGDGTMLPLAESTVSTLYCFSALYQIPAVERVFSEVSRVLKPGGRAILDLGNSCSLNAVCVRSYPDLPKLMAIPVSAMLGICKVYGLEVIEHRKYQFLPLWADKPRWLRPLLLPVWRKIMKLRLAGKMLDEHISSLPLLRNYAFRHLLICRKPGATVP